MVWTHYNRTNLFTKLSGIFIKIFDIFKDQSFYHLNTKQNKMKCELNVRFQTSWLHLQYNSLAVGWYVNQFSKT